MPAYEGQFENGTITVNVTQGTSPYTYTAYETDVSGVSTGVIAQDANEDLAQSIQSDRTYVFDNMPPGEYYVTVVDGEGCAVFGTTVIDSWPCTEFSLSASIDKHESLFEAADGVISYTVTAGENWDGSTTTSNYTISLILGGSIVQTSTTLTGSFTDLAPGVYTISVTETGSGSNCSDSVQLTINAFEEVLNRTFYWFHGYDLEYRYEPYGVVSTGKWNESLNNTFAVYDSSGTETIVDFPTAITTLLDNIESFNPDGGSVVQTSDMPADQTINDNGGQFEMDFPATEVLQYYYLAVPNNADFNIDLTQTSIIYTTTNTTPATANSERRSFTYNGEEYWLYRLYNNLDSALEVRFQ